MRDVPTQLVGIWGCAAVLAPILGMDASEGPRENVTIEPSPVAELVGGGGGGGCFHFLSKI